MTRSGCVLTSAAFLALLTSPAAAVTTSVSSVSLLFAIASAPFTVEVTNERLDPLDEDGTETGTGTASTGGGGAANGPALELSAFTIASSLDPAGLADVTTTAVGLATYENTAATEASISFLLSVDPVTLTSSVGDPTRETGRASYTLDVLFGGESLFSVAPGFETSAGTPSFDEGAGFFTTFGAMLAAGESKDLEVRLTATAFAETLPVAAIPLPFGAPMLVGALGLAFAVRRRAAARG